MPSLGPDGRLGVWRARGGEVIFVPFEVNDRPGLLRSDVFGVALVDAKAGEPVWVSLQTPGSIPGSQVLMQAEERVAVGTSVVLAGPTAVRPASAGEAKMPLSVQSSVMVYTSSRTAVAYSEETEVSSGRLLRQSAPAWPRGWGALVARVGKEGAGDLERGEPFTVASRRWPGILFGVKKDGSIAAVRVVREDGQPADVKDVAEVPAPTYPGNGGPPPWPEVALGRLLALEADETLLFGTGELGGVTPVTRRMRLGEE